MLFMRWIKNKQGRLACIWGEARKMGATQNHALSGEKSEVKPEDAENASCAGTSRRGYPAPVWVNPKRHRQSPSAQSGLPIGICRLARLHNGSHNITATLFSYYSGLLNLRSAMTGHLKTSAAQILTALLTGLYCCSINVAQAQPAEVQSTTPANSDDVAIAVTPIAQIAGPAPSAQEPWNVLGQSTNVTQMNLPFRSPYAGQNSLNPNFHSSETTDLTLFAGMRISSGGELWVNPEIDQGFGLNNTTGVAGYPSGEAYKVGANAPYFRLPRLFYRQVINLGGSEQTIESAANRLGGTQSSDNVILTIGKFSVVDVFDTNTYAHDPRSDFLNWSIVESGAFDYAADAWGYTDGASLEWTQSRWTLRSGFFALSYVPNSTIVDTSFSQHEWVEELEERHQLWGHPGKVKLLGYINQGRMGSYASAVQLAQQTNSTPDTSLVRHGSSQSGFAINLEQEVTSSLGAFSRASMNQGNKETFEFTDINKSVSAGLSMRGDQWGRLDDTFGFAAVANGLSGAARNYFAAGGLGVLIGDGQLPHYGLEKIMETYYSYSVRAVDHLMLTVDYQYIVNPAYNQDRGSVSIFGLRVHKEF